MEDNNKLLTELRVYLEQRITFYEKLLKQTTTGNALTDTADEIGISRQISAYQDIFRFVNGASKEKENKE